jgi:hypothetical protein
VADPLDFTTVTRPADDTPPGPTVDSDDPTCIVCGTPLVYSGRGPKPKYCDDHRKSSNRSSGGAKAASRDVERACESLSQLYGVTAMVLMVVSPHAADVWSENAEKLDGTNRTTLANNKKLVDRINKGAASGGSAAFIITHCFAVAPVVGAIREDLAARRTEADENMGTVHPLPTDPIDPDAAFRK